MANLNSIGNFDPRQRPHELKALVLEDDEWMKPVIISSLWEVAPGMQVDWVDTAEEGMNRIRQNAYAIIIADIFLNGNESGIEFWNHCQALCPHTPVLLTSAMPVDKFLQSISKEKVCPPFLPKPFKVGECRQMIEGLLSYLVDPELEAQIGRERGDHPELRVATLTD